MLTKGQLNEAEKMLENTLRKKYDTDIESASISQLYYALSKLAKELMYQRRADAYREENKNKKVVHYMSIEFLIGKNLKNNLWNLGLEESFRAVLETRSKDIEKVYAFEKDAGLGNGGLGRLAACYLDSLARLGYPAYGHCINYEYGLFNQKISEGKQIETPDVWLDTGAVWLEAREDQAVKVTLGGEVKQIYSEEGLRYEYYGSTVVDAFPQDMLISGYGSDTPSTLRLWSARIRNAFDVKKFDQGEYTEALRTRTEIEAINKVLYPSDATDSGRHLRLVQQYFLASAVMQNILNNFFKEHKLARHLPNYVSVHINDTHPVMCVPELMRILMDEHRLGWDEAWDIVKKTVSYTNHTILSEALEVITLSSIEKYIPRIAMIIKELDRRFRLELSEVFKNDYRKIESMSIISGNKVFMANLAIYASHAVNGVSKIHTHILMSKLFRNYIEIYPNKFINITNGITHRRWLCQANPLLSEFICKHIGSEFVTHPEFLQQLERYVESPECISQVERIKHENKQRFADYLKRTQGISIDPNARFDVQVKRIHEYKRQLLNAMRIIYLCEKIRENPNEPVTPQVFIFAGKAASGYVLAKRIIKLINQLSLDVDSDPVLAGKIKVVFVENYSVSLAEILMPATEVSQQISLAGREASGTGNMKAVINGALMMCTIDGANIEIADRCGHENVFEFGLTADDVEKINSRGYNAMDYYIGSDKVRRVVDKLSNGLAGESFADIVEYLLGHSDYKDSYMCLADFDSYIECHEKMDMAYKDREKWNQMSLKCISSMGYFSSDRAIEEYVQKIWKLKKYE